MLQNRNFVFLMALAFVGEGFLVFPFSSNTASDMVGVFSAIVFCVAAALLSKAAADFYVKRQFKAKEVFSCAIVFLFCIIMVFAAFNTAFSFSKYVAEVMLFKGWELLAFAVILVLSIITAVSQRRVLFKLGLVLFFVSAIFIVLMFCFSIPFMSLKYVIPYKSFSVSDSFDIFKNFSLSLLPLILPALILGKNQKSREFSKAFALGGVLLVLCFVNTLAVFGSEFASTLLYPYSSAVSTAEFGELFYRMDGFLYATCFFSCFAKTSAFLTATFILLREVLYKIILRKI